MICFRSALALVAQMVKNPPAMQEAQVQSLGREDALEKGIVTPSPVLLPREFREQRRLSGYSPWGHKESDTTEMTNSALALQFFKLYNL